MTGPDRAAAGRTIEVALEIGAPVEAVWRALAEAEEIQRWFAPEAEVSPGPGGSILWKWQEILWKSQIEAWEPGRRLRLVYDSSAKETGGPAGPTTLAMDFLIEPRGAGVVLRLVHSGFGHGAGWDEEYDGVRRGWAYELRSLRHYLENHLGERRRLAWARVPTRATDAEAWLRLAGPAGLLPIASPRELAEDSRYSLAAATGDRFEGKVLLHAPGKEFGATVEGLGNSLLRVALETCGSGPEAWIWLAAWRLPESEVEAFAARWQQQLAACFAESARAREWPATILPEAKR
jgi:uncharacterized protein YndB with AHSA1/START domain